ncbi:hypothetical protein GOBAR_DD36436 [Gossypium barbadense]|nr:hypothetical protein GOBAR_DD36436 [Gossypium barbadense]
MPLLEAPENWFCPGPKSVKPGGGSSPNFTWLRLWMVGITTTMLLRWVLSSQSGDDIGTITAEVEAPPYFPPPRDYKNQGYLMVSCNGGFLNLTLVVPVLDICVHIINNGGICKQICDMVAIARFLNLTLVVPVLDIWDVDYFIKSLSSEVRIIKHLPPRLRKKLRQMDSIQCSPLAYYYNTVFPRFQKYEVVRFAKTDSRLGNNLAVEVQKMRYAIPWWKEKEIDPKSQREAGLCPLTPLETAFTLRAFNIDPSIQIYRAVGNIYGGNRRLASLKAFYPNLHESGRFYGDVHRPNVRQFGSNDGPRFTGPVSREFVDGNRRPVLHGPNVAHTSPGLNIESHVGPHGVPSSNFVQVDQADPGSPEPIEIDQTSSNVVPLVWPYSSSSLAPCMMTPPLQWDQSPSNTPGSGDELM